LVLGERVHLASPESCSERGRATLSSDYCCEIPSHQQTPSKSACGPCPGFSRRSLNLRVARLGIGGKRSATYLTIRFGIYICPPIGRSSRMTDDCGTPLKISVFTMQTRSEPALTTSCDRNLSETMQRPAAQVPKPKQPRSARTRLFPEEGWRARMITP